MAINGGSGRCRLLKNDQQILETFPGPETSMKHPTNNKGSIRTEPPRPQDLLSSKVSGCAAAAREGACHQTRGSS